MEDNITRITVTLNSGGVTNFIRQADETWLETFTHGAKGFREVRTTDYVKEQIVEMLDYSYPDTRR